MLEIARSTPCLHCTFAPRTRVYAALHAAAFSGSLAAARQLLNVGGSAMIFAASNDGKSPLVLAAEQKKASMVKVQLRTNALDRTDVQLHKRAHTHTHTHTHTHSISWRKRSGPMVCLLLHHLFTLSLHCWLRDYHNKRPAEEDGKSMMDARQGWWLGGELSTILSGLASVAFALPPPCPSDTWNHGHTNTHARLHRLPVLCFVMTAPAHTDANHVTQTHRPWKDAHKSARDHPDLAASNPPPASPYPPSVEDHRTLLM